MLDMHYIRENIDKIRQGAKIKGFTVDLDRILALDTKKRDMLRTVENIRSERNQNAKILPTLKGQEKENSVAKGKELKEALPKEEASRATIAAELKELLLYVPNPPIDGIPAGKDERDNVEIKKWGHIL